jgi:hypothetical protein
MTRLARLRKYLKSNAARWPATPAARSATPACEPLEGRRLLTVNVYFEGGGTATEGAIESLTVSAYWADWPGSIDIGYTVSGTATGDDHTLASGTVTFTNPWPNLYPSMTIPLGLKKDNLVEGSESIKVTLQSGSGYEVGYPSFMGAPTGAGIETTLGITDDPPIVSIAVGDANATESAEGEEADTGTFIVTRTGGKLSEPIEVAYDLGGTATAGTDYTGSASGTVQVGTSGVITVTPKDDPDAEGEETITATLKNPGSIYLFGPPPATQTTVLPAAQPVKLGDNVSIASVTVAAEPATNQNAIYNAFNGYGFVARFTVTGENLTKIEAHQDINSSTAITDWNGTPLNYVGDVQLNSNGWKVDVGGAWGEQKPTIKDNSKDGVAYFTDNHFFTLTAQGGGVYNGNNVLIAAVFNATRYMHTKFRAIGGQNEVQINWGFKWNNYNLQWAQNDPNGAPPVTSCTRQGGAGIFYDQQNISGI